MEIEYRKAEISDLEAVQALIDLAFGAGYHKTKNLLGEEIVLFVAIVEGQIVGLASGEVGLAQCHLEFRKAASFLPARRIAILDQLIVHPDYRNKGIGRQLFRLRLAYLEGHAQHLALLHWKEGLFERPLIAIRNGFKRVQEFKGFWAKDSLRYGFSCDRCGIPPCQCTAVLYLKSGRSQS